MTTPGDMLLNTSAYSVTALLFMLAANIAWAIVFLVVFLNIRRHGAVEIPAAAVASNFAWVTVWATMYRTDLGSLFVWTNRLAMVLEVLVFGYVLLRGAQHVRTPEVRRWFKPGMVASYGCWFVMLYFFTQHKYDTTTGSMSFVVVSLYMSALYVLVELSAIDASQYSFTVACAKLIGNLCTAFFCVLAYPANHFLLSICAITFVLDALYLGLFRQRRSLGQPGRALA